MLPKQRKQIIWRIVALMLCVIAFTIWVGNGYVNIGVAGVSVAIVVAIMSIFRDWIVSLFFYPNLEIVFEIKPPDCHKTFITYRDKLEKVVAAPDCYYYRMRIENNGNWAARGIEAMIVEKCTKNQNGIFEKDKNFLPLIFRWSNDGVLRRDRIMPSLFRCCNFGYILHGKDKVWVLKDLRKKVEDDVIMVLDSDMKPNTGSHIILPGEHQVTIVVVGDNTRVTTRKFKIRFEDCWSDQEDDMLKKAVSVTPG